MEFNLKEITGITADSRLVKPGYIFVAIKGSLTDGHLYIDKAIDLGSSFIVHEDNISHKEGIFYLKVGDSRVALSELSAKLYPVQPKYILGVTGTSGKSSIVHFVRETIRLLGKKAVSIGTLGVIGDFKSDSSLTTPPTEKLHQLLQDIAVSGVEYTAVECSSHGIDQHRLDSVRFNSCAFTNFSRDHLDYHLNMEEYFNSKLKLFSILKNGNAILNTDIQEFKSLYDYCKDKHNIITYGKAKNSNVQILNIENNGIYQLVKWDIEGEIYKIKFNLVGEFQIYNLACAISLLLSANINKDDIFSVIEQLNSVTGRMEFVAQYNSAGIFVDYAHKPEALEHALTNLRKNTSKKLVVVFGCGGDRDQGKRKIMGEIASNLADVVIITDDNPRTEMPEKIRQEILSGCKENAIEISSREDAIKKSISMLHPGDNLIIAGKGHENYQIIDNKTFYFSDKETVLKFI